MLSFNERLIELIKLEDKSINDLANFLKLKDISLIYCWIRGEYMPSYTNILGIAEYFNVSLDYLVGRSEDISVTKFKRTPPFDKQIKKVLEEQKASQYKLIKDKIIKTNTLHGWCTLKKLPKIETLNKLADYFGVTLDYLVGRE